MSQPPMEPMQNPAFSPDIDQADSLPPQTLMDTLRWQVRVLKAAFCLTTGQLGIVSVVDLSDAQIGLASERQVDVVKVPGGARVRVGGEA